MDLSDIELDLFEGIPLAKEMGLKIVVAGSDRVTVGAPLSRNSNYTHTAFGGSIYSAAVLTCWVLIRLSIEGRDCHSRRWLFRAARWTISRP